MIVEVTGLETGTMESKAGKTLSGLNLTGIEIDRDGNAGDDYEKFLMDWKNEDEIETIIEAGVGATLDLNYVKDGRYYNLEGVEVVSEGDGASSVTKAKVEQKKSEKKRDTNSGKSPAGARTTAAKKTETASQAQAAVGAPVIVDVQKPDEVIRFDAVSLSVKLTNNMLAAPERFKKLLSVTKITAELLMQMTLENASKIEAYINGKFKADVSSDATDLQEKPVDAKEPKMPGEES